MYQTVQTGILCVVRGYKVFDSIRYISLTARMCIFAVQHLEYVCSCLPVVIILFSLYMYPNLHVLSVESLGHPGFTCSVVQPSVY